MSRDFDKTPPPVPPSLPRGSQEFRVFLETTPDLALIHDERHIIYVNPALVAALGYRSREELMAQRVGMLLAEEVRKSSLDDLSSALQDGLDGCAPLQRLTLLHRSGARLPVEVTVAAAEVRGRREVFLLARDVSAQRAQEARAVLAARVASMATLAAGVAHEINNPLAFVVANLGFIESSLEALRAGPGAPGAAELAREVDAAVAEAREGANRIQRAVRELRALAEPESGPRERVDLRAVLDASLARVEAETSLRARVRRSYAAIPPVDGNAMRLTQVFIALLRNSVQALPEGQPEQHEITVSTLTDEAGCAVAEVRDSGPGIAPELVQRLFDPFFTTRPTSAGLGLSLSYAIVTALGGTISVDSEPGRGTAVRVSLPAAR